MKRPLRNLMRSAVLAIALIGGLAVTSETANACPNCKDSLSEDSELGRLGKGYSWSVLIMLGVPGLMLAGMGGAAWFFIKRSNVGPEIDLTGDEGTSARHNPEDPPTDA